MIAPRLAAPPARPAAAAAPAHSRGDPTSPYFRFVADPVSGACSTRTVGDELLQPL